MRCVDVVAVKKQLLEDNQGRGREVWSARFETTLAAEVFASDLTTRGVNARKEGSNQVVAEFGPELVTKVAQAAVNRRVTMMLRLPLDLP